MTEWHELGKAFGLWPETAGARAHLLNLSENHTFRLDTPAGKKFVLRVHRPTYHSQLAIESELAWMRALRADAGLFTPQPIPGLNGQDVQIAPFMSESDQRHMVLFAFEEGEEPEEDEGLALVFAQLGELAARCHSHVEGWTAPSRFQRQIWTEGAILDADAIWGDWREAPNVRDDIRAVLDRLDQQLRKNLGQYGQQSDRFGLIHADMRLANLLVENGTTRLIDFDDCGFCWFGYDFAAAVSFFEDSPLVPQLRDAWLQGYRKFRAFGAEHEAMLDTMVMLRRMALLAWIGSHSETELAQSLRADFANITAEMAERFLVTGTIDRG